MIITEETKNTHRRLSECSVKFLQKAEKNPQYLERSAFASLTWPNPQVKLQAWPTFIDRAMRKQLADASVDVVKLIKSIPRRIFGNDTKKISRYFGIPLEFVELGLFGVTDHHLDNLLGRGDFVLAGDGSIKCIEFNIASDLGGWELPMWERMYQQQPLINGFLRENQVKVINENLIVNICDHLINSAISKASLPLRNGGEINIMIIIKGYQPGMGKPQEFLYFEKIYQDLLRRKYPGYTGKIIVSDYRFTRVKDGYLYYNNDRAYVIVEQTTFNISMAILDIFNRGNLLILNGPISLLTANKFNIALLSQYQDSDLFTPEERECIKKHIPWTRKMERGETTFSGETINLEDFILKNRERLILKPTMERGGKGLTIGHSCTENQWCETVNEAFEKKVWVVQEFVAADSFLYRWGEKGSALHQGIWGTFVFGNRYGGTWLRILPNSDNKGVINSSQGAWESVILEVDE